MPRVFHICRKIGRKNAIGKKPSVKQLKTMPGKVDCLVSMEVSELLRPGSLDLLKEEGAIICAHTKVVPQKLAKEQYPDFQAIKECTSPYNFILVDFLGKVLEIGDNTGRIANVVMMGVLSTVTPLDAFPVELWLKALQAVTPHSKLWAANYAAFRAGRRMI